MSLMLTLAILFIVSLTTLYLNKNQVMDTRASANNMRAAQAQELVDSAIDWAVGMASSPLDLDNTCTIKTSPGTQTFRRRYIQGDLENTSDVTATSWMHVGCRIAGDGSRTCDCPTPTDGSTGDVWPNPSGAAADSFVISFEDVPNDTKAIRMNVQACIGGTGMCTPTIAQTADGSARGSVVMKLLPTLRMAPEAALNCGRNCATGGANLKNTDVNTNGTLVDAGGSVTGLTGTMTTLSGTPLDNAFVRNDISILFASQYDPYCTNSAVFQSYFAVPLAQYAAAIDTKKISCSSASSCASAVNSAFSQGWRNFYFTSAAVFNSGTYGTPTDPVFFIGASDIDFSGPATINGLLYTNSTNWTQNTSWSTGLGYANINGTVLACHDVSFTAGNVNFNYAPDVVFRLRNASGSFAKVPGSWRDF